MVGLMQACRWEYLRVGMNTCFSCIGPTAYGCCLCPSRSNFKHPNYNATRTVSVRMDSSEVYAIKEECWACGKIKSGKNFLMCPFCNVVQPPNSDITYFDIFDQEQRFDIDLKDLEAKYKSLMKTLHPDLTHGKSVQEKEYYAQWSALVTTAYTDLLKPVSRATYLLKLRGIHVEEEGTVTDPDLITEVMDFREALQSMPDRKTLEELNKKASGRMDDWRAAFKAAFEEGNNTAAVGALQRMSYFGRVCEDINRELL
ncbi:hypothetical protein KP509_04G014400 [Ceratopteris richardii]|nr:hypothetical protein KP509_04G014400 [Ceratopteris richardii]